MPSVSIIDEIPFQETGSILGEIVYQQIGIHRHQIGNEFLGAFPVVGTTETLFLEFGINKHE